MEQDFGGGGSGGTNISASEKSFEMSSRGHQKSLEFSNLEVIQL